MTASSPSRHAARRPLRMTEAVPLGALFLGLVALASLPVAEWVGPWLVVAPGAALLAACALRLSQWQQGQGHHAAQVGLRRRRPATAVQARRRAAQPRRASRLLAALVLR